MLESKNPELPGMPKKSASAKAIAWLEKYLFALNESYKKQVEKVDHTAEEINELEILLEELKHG